MEELFGSAALVALFGAIAPFVVALLRRRDWPPWAVHGTALIVAVVFGVLALWVRVDVVDDGTGWQAETVIGHAAVVAVVSHVVYGVLLTGAGRGNPAARLVGMLESIGTPNVAGGGDSRTSAGGRPGEVDELEPMIGSQ